jgi:hypothetical protein
MILNGVDEQAAGLTLIPGVGDKWVRKLMGAGIANLSDLATCPLSRLANSALSENRARKWLAAAPELLQAQPATQRFNAGPILPGQTGRTGTQRRSLPFAGAPKSSPSNLNELFPALATACAKGSGRATTRAPPVSPWSKWTSAVLGAYSGAIPGR